MRTRVQRGYRARRFHCRADRVSRAHTSQHADLEWATGIIWGSPTRYGLMSTPLRAFIDEVAPLWRQGALIGKVGAAFTSTGGMHSGNEMTLLNLLLPFLQHGMILAGVPHSVPALVHTRSGGSPYGASAVTGFNGTLGVDEGEQAIAQALGARVARLAGQVIPEPASVDLAAAVSTEPAGLYRNGAARPAGGTSQCTPFADFSFRKLITPLSLPWHACCFLTARNREKAD
ncbi:NAD(P)H-dependent oxidoreductase [Halopseudomonas pachastrellae]|nr:NAD(P)H-dependent oxidoreductase [Halopseudomonas pachastrellae]